MADEETKPTTEYRVLRRLTETEMAELDPTSEVWALAPKTYTGNVKRAVYEELGEGDYIKVAARSLDPFPVRTKQVVTFSA